MAINISDIITVLNSKQKTYSILETIILEYGSLGQKMTHIEDQTWIFKKGEEKHQPLLNSIGKIALESLSSNIAYIEELLAIKSRVDEMKSLEYYLENKEALIKLFGW